MKIKRVGNDKRRYLERIWWYEDRIDSENDKIRMYSFDKIKMYK